MMYRYMRLAVAGSTLPVCEKMLTNADDAELERKTI